MTSFKLALSLKLVCALGLVTYMSSRSVVTAQGGTDDISSLISSAPVAQASQAAEGEETMVLFLWLRALAYSGRDAEAYSAETTIGKKLEQADFFGAIAEGLRLIGKTEQALALAHRIKRDSHFSSQTVAIRVFLTIERYDDAVHEAKTISDLDERGQQLCLIGKVLARRGHYDQALRIGREARMGRYFPDSNMNNVLTEVARRLASEGRAAESIATARQITNPQEQSITLEDCASRLAVAGKASDAIAAAKSIVDTRSRSSAMLDVVGEFCKRKHWAQALDLIVEMSDPYQKALAFAETAVAANEAGNAEKFVELIGQAKSAAISLKEMHARNKALSQISITLAEGGLLDAALEMARECKDDNERAWAYETIVSALLQANRYEQAFAIARSIPEEFGQRDRTIAMMVQSVNTSPNAAEFRSTVNNPSFYGATDHSALVEGLTAGGKTEEAARVASEITDSDQRCRAFSLIASSRARARLYEQARIAANNCASPINRLYAYTDILTAYALETNPRLQQALEKDKILNW